MNPTYDFTGQVAVVTGASSGMGLATAQAFAEAGAAVVLADINDQMLGAATDELTASGYRALAVSCDVSDEDQAAEIANGTAYGLAGAVWSADRDHAVAFARRMRTGQVDINGARFNPIAPFGGVKQSGYGRELGRYGLEEFLTVKSLQL